MKWIVALSLLATMLSGCAVLALPALEEGGTLLGIAGSGASGISGVMGTESTVNVNSSWIENNKVQARYARAQMRAMARKRHTAHGERATSIGILREMAAANGDPRLADLAQWVKAGGNPQFALNFALARSRDDSSRRQAVRILETLSEKENNPKLYQLALWVRSGGDEKFALDYALNHSPAGDWTPSESRTAIAPLKPASAAANLAKSGQ